MRGLSHTTPLLVLLLGGLLLGACETTGGADPAEPAAEAAAESEQAALPPEPEPEPEPDIDDDPEQLIGLDPGAVHDLLGVPSLVRREGPAQIWQYQGDTCIFDVVLYDEPEGDQVTYVEARDNRGSKGEARACLNQLLRARLQASTS